MLASFGCASGMSASADESEGTSVGSPALRERLALAGDQVTLNVIPQHPRTTPTPIQVSVKAPVYAGPVGPDLAVFDYDRERDRLLPAAIPDHRGAFPAYPVEDPRFHQLNAYAIAVRAVDLVEYELGRLLDWGLEANRLIVLPHAGYLANAFYEEYTHSLQFYSFRQLDGSIYHTSLVHDIVAHETGMLSSTPSATGTPRATTAKRRRSTRRSATSRQCLQPSATKSFGSNS